ncbi:hypothetical protein AMS68_001883 [Peltaster fructicola]|uniref:Fatty acid hydroxylase domain-containing protein n=1 Tax=Peltaster fructicola TaxID=286661 RepID=A0A6H0XNV8_9PEZI|nr:hypothetical protein AMS68_001883 [Peltaster fructicola]
MANTTLYQTLPPLPSYTLTPLEPLIPGFPDPFLAVALPVVAYWIVSLTFHFIDEWDLFPQYRLHTPAEVLKRNHVSKKDVLRDVIFQQIIQTFVGLAFSLTEAQNMTGKEQYDVAWWAQCIRVGQSWLPNVLRAIGVDSMRLAQSLDSTSFGMFSGALAGGIYPELSQVVLQHGEPVVTAAFADWEILAAKAIYHIGIPAVQFFMAVLFLDTWQYFLHRAMHMNKWLYTTFHARHHRLYVPYAYGALYNHPFEGFLLDSLGAAIAYLVTGMTVRQSMWFYTVSTIKTVDDHSGYSFPWDPLQHLTSNNAGYHDVHHQSWGIKTNFSQPFFTFWDTLLGTKWTGGDVSVRYEKARIAAQAKVDADNNVTGTTPTAPSPNPYFSDDTNATSTARSAQSILEPRIPPGKATQQAVGSRQMVLDSHGIEPLLEETAEEIKAQVA